MILFRVIACLLGGPPQTSAVRQMMLLADDESKVSGEAELTSSHILLAILRMPDCAAVRILLRRGVDLKALEASLRRTSAHGARVDPERRRLAKDVKRLFFLAHRLAWKRQLLWLGTEHYLQAVFSIDSPARCALEATGLSGEAWEQAVSEYHYN